MSSLSIPNRAFLEAALGMSGGYVLDFTNTTFAQFFDALDIDIYDEQYAEYGASKAKRMQTLWHIGSDVEVAATLTALADYMEAKQWVGGLHDEAKDTEIAKIREIARGLAGGDEGTSTVAAPMPIASEATVNGSRISIEIHEDIYGHIGQFLAREDYFQAVEEAYKVVREKLRELTGNEKATEVFNQSATGKAHYKVLFGKAEGANDGEADFFRGVGYLHLGVQFLRNEKAHTLATPLEQNLALHYISLASLAYDLITRHISEEAVAEIEELVQTTRRKYSATRFYPIFEQGKWIDTLELPDILKSTAARRALRDKWLKEADFTRSYDHSNVVLMRLELIVDVLTADDIDHLLDLPTVDAYGNDQMVGLDLFLKFVDQKDPTKLSAKARAVLANPEGGAA